MNSANNRDPLLSEIGVTVVGKNNGNELSRRAFGLRMLCAVAAGAGFGGSILKYTYDAVDNENKESSKRTAYLLWLYAQGVQDQKTLVDTIELMDTYLKLGKLDRGDIGVTDEMVEKELRRFETLPHMRRIPQTR